MLAFINFPTWIRAEIISGLPVRWYGLMYLIAFSIAYFLMIRQTKEKNIGFSEDDLINCFFYGILGLILGARILATTVYDPSHFYIKHPWLIFWPISNGHFTGLQGMSYHGGVIGAIIATVIFCRKKKLDWFNFADIAVAGIPLGYTFGRLGNFINGELWGRVTTKSWGIIFPHAEKFDVSLNWVKKIATEIGINLKSSGTVNLPRHPSQLYEAFFEGVVLWLFIWFFIRTRKKFHGAVISWYLIGYGVVRFIIEYFREPDSYMGFPLQFGTTPETTAVFSSFLNFSTGQILCAIMILGGTSLFFIRKKITGNTITIDTKQKKDASRSKQKNSNKKKKKK